MPATFLRSFGGGMHTGFAAQLRAHNIDPELSECVLLLTPLSTAGFRRIRLGLRACVRRQFQAVPTLFLLSDWRFTKILGVRLE